MRKMQGYNRCAAADNVSIFHGREIRQVTTVLVCFDVLSCIVATFMTLCKVASAAGGMGFVLHLSLANGADSEGWSQQEIAEYDGWGHDSSRHWRKAPQLHKERAKSCYSFNKTATCRNTLQQEGFSHFTTKFGAAACVYLPPPVDVKKLLCSKTPSHRYTLHHRFYFHTDEGARLWLTAEVFHTPNLTPPTSHPTSHPQPHTPNND